MIAIDKIKKLIPELADNIEFDKIIYYKENKSLLFFFKSNRLMSKDDFASLKFAIVEVVEGFKVSLVVSIPSLREDFFADPNSYSYLISDIISDNNPLYESWEKEIKWKLEDNALSIAVSNKMVFEYFQQKDLRQRIENIINAMFGTKISVRVYIGADEEEQIKRSIEILERQAEEKKLAIIERENESETERMKKRSPRILGKDINGAEVKNIAEIGENFGVFTIEGKVSDVERKDFETATLVSFVLYDGTSSMLCKAFFRTKAKQATEDMKYTPKEIDLDKVEADINRIELGVKLKVRGESQLDNFTKQVVIMAYDINELELEKRKDNADRKRVELHAHTHMSLMDGAVSAENLFEMAKNFGHKALAITDNAVVQAFPAAFTAAAKNKVKILPGVEINMITEHKVVINADTRSINSPIVVFDMETTGLTPREQKIIEIGAIKVVDGSIVDSFSEFIDPGFPIPVEVTTLTNISDSMVRGARKIEEVLPDFMRFVEGSTLAAHNAKFDCAFLRAELKKTGTSLPNPQLDTLIMAQNLFPNKKSYRLEKVCDMLGIALENAHRAIHDANATAECLVKMLEMLEGKGVKNLEDINTVLNSTEKARKYNATLLARTQEGMFNINRIVSEAHINYFTDVATVPKHIVEQYREGILIGSNSASSELFEALRYEYSDNEIEKLMDFYDYLEIQPVGNFKLLTERGEIQSEDTLRSITRDIIELGKKFKKPVVATGEVHYLEEEDKIYRTMLQFNGRTEKTADIQPSYYFRTTDEMLNEFNYLGEELAREVVIDNTNLIADMVEELSLYPKHPQGLTTFSPVWENAGEEISLLSYKNAEERYGTPLPEIVDKRLKKELNSIVGYGYATLYSIAIKLVEKSMESGYIVGSRGSVGSSLVATMCRITEVNPLPPHYVCQKCKYNEFDVPKEYKIGVDLPKKRCPRCDTPMEQDGFDIPFEVFLGFKGDKVPDIDLNFSGDYQAKAHAYVEELFGKGYVFRAGTIGTLRDKTARAMILDYFEKHDIVPSDAEVKRLIKGCIDAKRTTGQHPGGMVILPKDYDINQFTAIQHPADDKDSSIITTHYDFASMHDILVKLDILGHDDPTIIYWLEKWTGVDCKSIPLNDEKVMSLFTSPNALGVNAEDIGCETGTLGIPEFGTGFVRQLLLDTKPSTMEELIMISGLSHGTDVWLDNAEDIILNNTAKLKDCICVRDDIMNYLISLGLPEKLAFDIMENVRKGKKLAPGTELEDKMRENNVPDWYIESCKKIGYLFPKAHAVAYVTMALRVAWYKVYYPLQYYAAYFSIRANGFNSQEMIRSVPTIKGMIKQREEPNGKGERSAKEKDELVALELVLEMNGRGYEFLPVDLYKSDVKYFRVEGNKIRCPFISLPNFGESAAESIVEQRGTPFVSIEDLKTRTKITSTGVELLKSIGALGDLSDNNQVSFF